MIAKDFTNKEIIDNLDDIVDVYLNKLKNWKSHVNLHGKNIELANTEQTAWAAYYDEIKVQVKSLLNIVDHERSVIYGKMYSELSNSSSSTLTDRSKDKIIIASNAYCEINIKYLKIAELYDLLSVIVDNIKMSAYSINNIVKLRIAALQDVNIYEQQNNN